MFLKLKKNLLVTKAFLESAIESMRAKNALGKILDSKGRVAGNSDELASIVDADWNPTPQQLEHLAARNANVDNLRLKGSPKKQLRGNQEHWFSPKGATPYKGTTQKFPQI